MPTFLKPLIIREKLLQKKMRLFTRDEFGRLFSTSQDKIKYFLEEQVKEGLFTRLKNGLYMLKTDPAEEMGIANRLYQPSYLSFEYVLAYYNLLPEMPYGVTSATTKPTRNFIINEINFNYLTIKKEAYTGYYLKDGILIAEPEKAAADYLYFVALGKKTLNERLNWPKLNQKKLLKYCRLFKRRKLEDLCLRKGGG